MQSKECYYLLLRSVVLHSLYSHICTLQGQWVIDLVTSLHTKQEIQFVTSNPNCFQELCGSVVSVLV